ncbi:MAG: electron transport complex subunit RsxG [Vibrio sp.]
MLQSIQKNGLRLAIFAIGTTALVALTNALTEDQIKAQEQKQLRSVLNEVIPASMHDNQLTQSCILLPSQTPVTEDPLPAYIAKKDGQVTAIAIETYAPEGYAGPIKLIVGLDMHGTVLGSRVLTHKETPGLGDKIDLRVSDWILSFTQKKVTQDNLSTWAVRKDGGEFDQFTGATITPRAVVKAVKNTALYFNKDQDAILNQSTQCEG